MSVTQLDIARLAKVSQATVSRILAGDDKVEPESRERVLGIVQAHNYRPNVRARALRLRRTGLIGLVSRRPVGSSEDPFFTALTAGILDYLRGKSIHLCVDVITDESSESRIYDEMLRSGRVDGLILVEPEAADERTRQLVREGFPLVVVGDPKHDAICSVDSDHRQAGRIALRHLTESGYRRVAVLGGPEGNFASDDRIQSYRQAAQAMGVAPIVAHSARGCESARRSALALLLNERPDAVLALDDFMAWGVVLAARQLGRSVPRRLGLVSLVDSSLCSLFEAGITSLNLGIEHIARRAVEKLLRLVDNEGLPDSPVRELVACELRVRGSSPGPSSFPYRGRSNHFRQRGRPILSASAATSKALVHKEPQ